MEHDDRLVDHDAGGDLDERAAGEERVVQDGEGVGRSLRTGSQHPCDLGLLAGSEAADDDTLRDERLIELVVHDPPVAHDHQAGSFTCLRRDRAAARRRLRPGLAQLVARRRTEAV